MIGSRRLGFRTFEKDADRLDTELFGADLPPGPIGTAAWNHIHVIPPDGATVTSYPVTAAGLAAAAAAATVPFTVIWIPPCNITADATVSAQVGMSTLGRSTRINGTITLNSGSFLNEIIIQPTATQAGELKGVIGPSSGIAYMVGCSVVTTNNGVGDATAVSAEGAGELWVYDCNTYGNATGGGAGYGVKRTAGTVYVTDDGRHRGSTGKFSGKVELFDPEDVIHLKTSTFTQLYNATDAGLTAALAAASSGDTVRLPDRCAISGGPWTNPSGVVLTGTRNSQLTGTLTNNGTTEEIRINGNFINVGVALRVYVNCTSGAGFTQGSGTPVAYLCGVDTSGTATHGYNITVGTMFFCNASGIPPAGCIGLYVNGATVVVHGGRFLGNPGAQIEACRDVSNIFARGLDSSDGLYHTTGTGYVSNSRFWGDAPGVDVNLAAAGLTFYDIGFGSITGEANITYSRGDRANYSVEDYHATDIEADVLTRHLPAPTSDAGDAGKSAVLNSGATAWELGSSASGGGIFPLDPYSDEIVSNGYVDEQTNQWQRRNAITSFATGGTTYQAIVFWDNGDYLNIGKRTLDGAWTIYTYNGTGGLPTIQVSSADNHRAANIGIDDAGFIHVVYDNRSDPLNYRRSDAAINTWTGGLTAETSMLGTTPEDRVTYPTFVNDPAGVLYFLFLNSNVGNTAADWYFYQYTSGTTTWAAAAGTGANGKLIDGITDTYVTYIHYPVFDSDYGSGGYFHLGFHFNTASNNQDVSYVKWDGTNWTQSDGSAQTVPIRIGNADIFDPAASGGLTSFGSVYTDSSGNPYIAYSKESEGGFRHVHIATHTSGVWTIAQVSESEAPTGGDGDGLYLWNPLLVIDRATDTGYIFYTDDRDIEGMLVQVSSDFTNWDRYVVYPRATGRIAANLDFEEFERDGLFYLALFLWESGESSLPIRLMKWDDTDDYEKFKIQVEEHDHSGLGEGGITNSAAGGYWEPAVLDTGEEFFWTSDGDIVMVWIPGG